MEVEIVSYNAKGKPAIKKKEAFAKYAPVFSFDMECSFKDLLSIIDQHIKADHPQLNQGSFNNSHGDWYEWLLAIAAWNYRIEHSIRKGIYLIPKASSLKVWEFYEERYQNHIKDLKDKLSANGNVGLITSNPDFMIVDFEGLEVPDYFNDPITNISLETIDMLEKAHQFFIGKCSFYSLLGYVSIKTSLRSDRRFQFAHEGSLMKALYIHIQTREWILKPPGLNYYAVSQSWSEADLDALTTVATHSITSVQDEPEPAVNRAFEVSTINEAAAAFNEIFNPSA